MSLNRAQLCTFAAADALIFIVCKLRLEIYALRVVTPHTLQGATLEEHRGPYAVTVVHGKALYL
jgi:hypothetical protein